MPLVVLFGILGCLPDDWNGEPYLGPPSTAAGETTGDTGDDAQLALVGSWISQGADLSPLFADLVRVDAAFAADGGYATTTVTADEQAVLTGTWTADQGTAPATVVLDQLTPYVAEANGIWEVDGDTLTFEVVQVVPDYGYVPPTPESGFGSTTGPGLVPGANVQIYRRVP